MSEVLASSAGYQVIRDGSRIGFAHRRTRGPLLVFLISGGVALAAWVVGTVIAVSESPTVLAVLGPLGLVAAGLSWWGFRIWRKRVVAPVDAFVTLNVRLDTRTLEQRGKAVASMDELAVETKMNIGDSTQGSMRWVVLTWPGGSSRVYTAGKDEAERVASLIGELLA